MPWPDLAKQQPMELAHLGLLRPNVFGRRLAAILAFHNLMIYAPSQNAAALWQTAPLPQPRRERDDIAVRVQAYLSDVLEESPTAKQSDLKALPLHNWSPPY